MIDPVAAALAAQLTLAGLAKGQGSAPADHTLLAALWPRVPARVFAAGDLTAAALLVWPGTTPIAAGLTAAAIGGSEVVVSATSRRGVTSCGCLGSARDRRAWREHAAKAVMFAEAGGALAASVVQLSTVGLACAAAVTTVAVLLLAPGLGGALLRQDPLTWREALRVLSKHPDYQQWGPRLLDPRPAEVRQIGRSWRIVLDAWSGERPVLLVAVVSPSHIELRAHDAVTMTLLR